MTPVGPIRFSFSRSSDRDAAQSLEVISWETYNFRAHLSAKKEKNDNRFHIKVNSGTLKVLLFTKDSFTFHPKGPNYNYYYFI